MAILGPGTGGALAQGIRMPPDFLPLDVGNLWRYEITHPDQSIESMEIQILDFIIVDATSMYVFSRFPLAPETPTQDALGIRYEQGERQFVWYDGARFVDLFPAVGATAEILESDDQGVPFKARFGFEGLEIDLERGVGIVEARMGNPGAVQVARLTGARIGGSVIGRGPAPAPESTSGPVRAGPDLVVAPSTEVPATPGEAEPVLSLEVREVADGLRFVLVVENPSDRLMPFHFTSSQSFDFVVSDRPGNEVWRWSSRKFFSEVIRSEAIRPRSNWTFEGEWNHRDNALEPVPPGTYTVVGILAGNDPVESMPVEFTVN